LRRSYPFLSQRSSDLDEWQFVCHDLPIMGCGEFDPGHGPVIGGEMGRAIGREHERVVMDQGVPAPGADAQGLAFGIAPAHPELRSEEHTSELQSRENL